MKRISILVLFILLSIHSPVLAASISETTAVSQTEKDAILRSIAKKCPPQWCEPEIRKIIESYASVLFRCKKKNCENDIAFLKKTGNKWILVDQGTGITPDDLTEQGFPGRIANKLVD